MFHKHKFNLRGNSLWCECGKIKELKCEHKWRVHSEQAITTIQKRSQTQQILICENCGKIKAVNLTTGYIE